jgi:hypothetical protein
VAEVAVLDNGVYRRRGLGEVFPVDIIAQAPCLEDSLKRHTLPPRVLKTWGGGRERERERETEEGEGEGDRDSQRE